MAIPASAQSFDQSLGSKEVLDFQVGVGGLLETGEGVDTWDLSAQPEAIAAGFILMDGARDPVYDTLTKRIRFWAEIDDTDEDGAEFLDGVTMGLEVLIVTDNTLSRTRHRTFSLPAIRK